MTVSGTVACQSGAAVTGIWIQSSNGGSGWAKRTARSGASWISDYTFAIKSGKASTSVELAVGCGGTPTTWASSNKVKLGTLAGSKSFSATCKDVKGKTAYSCSSWKSYSVMAATAKMSGPYLTNYAKKGTYAKAAKVKLACYTWGQSISGWAGTSNLWYRTSDGNYIADTNVNTGSNSAVTAACPRVSLATFVSDTRGKTWANAAGGFSGECVSLVSQYLWRVYGIKSGSWGNAVDYRSAGTGGNQLKAKGFAWSTNKSFKNGDILVWGSAPYGHIGIYYNGQVYDQNDGRHAPARTANYSGNVWASSYLGHWRK